MPLSPYAHEFWIRASSLNLAQSAVGLPGVDTVILWALSKASQRASHWALRDSSRTTTPPNSKHKDWIVAIRLFSTFDADP